MFVFFCQLHIYFWPQSTQMYPATLLTRKSRSWWQGPLVFEIQDTTGFLWQKYCVFFNHTRQRWGIIFNINLALPKHLMEPHLLSPRKKPKRCLNWNRLCVMKGLRILSREDCCVFLQLWYCTHQRCHWEFSARVNRIRWKATWRLVAAKRPRSGLPSKLAHFMLVEWDISWPDLDMYSLLPCT